MSDDYKSALDRFRRLKSLVDPNTEVGEVVDDGNAEAIVKEVHLSLSVTVKNLDQRYRAHEIMLDLSRAMMSYDLLPSLNIFEIDQEEETYSDQTLFTVLNTLVSTSGLASDQAMDIINDLLNAGILFRERD